MGLDLPPPETGLGNQAAVVQHGAENWAKDPQPLAPAMSFQTLATAYPSALTDLLESTPFTCNVQGGSLALWLGAKILETVKSVFLDFIMSLRALWSQASHLTSPPVLAPVKWK